MARSKRKIGRQQLIVFSQVDHGEVTGLWLSHHLLERGQGTFSPEPRCSLAEGQAERAARSGLTLWNCDLGRAWGARGHSAQGTRTPRERTSHVGRRKQGKSWKGPGQGTTIIFDKRPVNRYLGFVSHTAWDNTHPGHCSPEATTHNP